MDEAQTRMLCSRLDDLALLALKATDDGGTISLHDVVRDYLHDQLADRVPRTHQQFLDAVAADLARVPAAASGGTVVAWWHLPEQARYLREHLIEHLRDAGRAVEAESLAADLQWVQSRLQEAGPVAPFTDLRHITTPRATRLSRLLSQSAHLLAPTDPPHSLLDALYCLVAHDPGWGPQAHTLAQTRTGAALRTACPLPDLPDLPDPAVRRVITGRTRLVSAVAIAPDGSWLATGGYDGKVRLWDAATGAERARLTGHTGLVNAVAIAPDGSWLATTGNDQTIRIHSADRTGVVAMLRLHQPITCVAWSPDGNQLVAGGSAGLYRFDFTPPSS